MADSYGPPPAPPPPRQEPVLAGEPAPAPSAQSVADARAAERQAHDDAWISHLPDGLIARRTVDANGRVVWVISNRPIANPTERHVFYKWHGGYAPHRAHHTYAAAGPRHETPAAVASTPAPVTVAPKTQTAPAPAPKVVAKAAPAPAPTPAATAPASETPRPFVMSPLLWLVAGIALVLLLLLIMLGNRKPKRRGGGQGGNHTAPAH
jgi:hypothetical protein